MLLGVLEGWRQVARVVEDRLIGVDKADNRFLGMSEGEDRPVLGMMVLLFVSGTILEATFL